MKVELAMEFLSPAIKNSAEIAKRLCERFGSFREVAEADSYVIEDAVGDAACALYIKLAVALASRRICDRFKFGRSHTEEETKEYLKHLFFGLSIETVYLISIDGLGKAIACDRVGEGTVNLSNVLPRRLLEAAKRRGAKSVIIAHNHPGGFAMPSTDDVTSTSLLRELFESSGIKLINHYVVAGDDCECVMPC